MTKHPRVSDAAEEDDGPDTKRLKEQAVLEKFKDILRANPGAPPVSMLQGLISDGTGEGGDQLGWKLVGTILEHWTEQAEQSSVTAHTCSSVTRKVLEDVFDISFHIADKHDIFTGGIKSLLRQSSYRDDDLGPLYSVLEEVYLASDLKNEASGRLLINAYFVFIATSITKAREEQIKAIVKEEISKSGPDFDMSTLVPPSPHRSDDELLTTFRSRPEGAGLPPHLADCTVDQKASYILWRNYFSSIPSRLWDLEGVKELQYLRLYPEISLGPDNEVSKGVTVRGKDGNLNKLTGISDCGLLLVKSRDHPRFKTRRSFLEDLEGTDCLLAFSEEKSPDNHDLENQPLSEASAQAYLFSELSKRKNVRYLITNSSDWILAHLHNPLDGTSRPKVTSAHDAGVIRVSNPFRITYDDSQELEEALERWRSEVRTVYLAIKEWLFVGGTDIKASFLSKVQVLASGTP